MTPYSTLWTGKHEDAVNAVNHRLRQIGPLGTRAEQRVFKAWKSFTTAYYRRHNDGDAGTNAFKFADRVSRGQDRPCYGNDDLEALGERLLVVVAKTAAVPVSL